MRFMGMTAVLVAAAITAGCGGASGSDGYAPTTPGSGTTVATNTNQVTLANLTFSPGAITVPAGTTVTWNWNDCSSGGYGGYAGCVSHNVTFDDGSNIASATQDNGTFSRTFSTAGTFKYHCSIHGSSMSGQVIVK
jgi:plastocyanin